MGKGKRSIAEIQAHNFSGRQKENCSRTEGAVGEDQGGEELSNEGSTSRLSGLRRDARGQMGQRNRLGLACPEGQADDTSD
jgi:hypothetical protein